MKRKVSVDPMVALAYASRASQAPAGIVSALPRAALNCLVRSLVLFCLALAGWGPTLAQAPARMQTLTVLSSLPEAYSRARAAAFERANPDLRIELIHQRSALALGTLRATGPLQRPDLIWSASTEVFDTLAAEGLLQALETETSPGAVTGDRSARVLSLRAQHLVRLGLEWSAASPGSAAAEWPRRWQDLAQAACSARLSPQWTDRSGVAPLLIEVILQDQGWDAGWQTLARLAANTAPEGATGPRIQFVLEDAVTDPARLVQPALTAIMSARLAIVAGSRDPRQAQRFIRFVSAPATAPPAGSKPEVDPPVRTDTVRQYLTLDAALLERRQRVLATLVDQTLVQPLDQLKAACRAIDQASRRLGTGGDPDARALIEQARALSFSPILAEPALRAESITLAFSDQIREPLRRPRVAALESLWASQAQQNYTRALRIATDLSSGGRR